MREMWCTTPVTQYVLIHMLATVIVTGDINSFLRTQRCMEITQHARDGVTVVIHVVGLHTNQLWVGVG